MSKKWWYILIGLVTIIIISFALYSYWPKHPSPTNSHLNSPDSYATSQPAFGLAPSDLATPILDEKRKIAMEMEATATGADDNIAVTDRLIIKNGTLSMVVDEVSASIEKIKNYAIAKGGFVVNSNLSKYGVAPTGNITVRIPVEVFDAGFEEVKSFGQVREQTINGQDVTEEFIDLDSQLTNLRATESQFLEIMKKALKIQDVLDVQRELTLVRGQINSIEGRMKYLRESAAMSTLTVYLSTDPSALPVIEDQDQWKPFGVIKDAFRSLIELGKFLANGIIWLLIFIPLWIVISLIVWLIMRLVKKKKK